MIKKVSAMDSFYHNLERTEMLITAMEKIKVYNSLYQQKTFGEDPQFGYIVREVQDKELRKIEISCAEHAIISLATNFEIYYKELLQELLYAYPSIFIGVKSKYKDKLRDLTDGIEYYEYEHIADYLGLKNRKDFLNFFEEYSIPILTDAEKHIIEHIYTMRNCYVHNAGKRDKKTIKNLDKYPSPTGENRLTTEARRLRTKFNRLMIKANDRVIKECERIASK
jgi:hypothetical protein